MNRLPGVAAGWPARHKGNASTAVVVSSRVMFRIGMMWHSAQYQTFSGPGPGDSRGEHAGKGVWFQPGLRASCAERDGGAP